MAKQREALDPDELMTYNEATEALSVDRTTLWRWVGNGIISTIKLGKAVFFHRKDIERLREKRQSEE